MSCIGTEHPTAVNAIQMSSFLRSYCETPIPLSHTTICIYIHIYVFN